MSLSICNIGVNAAAKIPACSRANPINTIKKIKATQTDFKERYKMPFYRFIKLIKNDPNISIDIESVHYGNISYYEIKIKSDVYSVTFRIK